MSRLDELIKQYCSDGVEFRVLKDCCDLNKGEQLNKELLSKERTEEFCIPVINGGKNPSGYWNRQNRCANVITISQGGASAGYVDYQGIPFWSGAHCYVLDNCSADVIYKYLYYNVKSFENVLMKAQYGGGIPALGRETVENLLIPIPPLPVQQEIVRILDRFTELEAELEAELLLRKKQYEWYRDQLLTFRRNGETDVPLLPWLQRLLDQYAPNGVEWKKLGEVLRIKNGSDYKQFGHGNVPVYGSGGIMTYVDTYVYDKPSVLIPRKGSLDKLYYVDVPFWNVDTIFYT